MQWIKNNPDQQTHIKKNKITKHPNEVEGRRSDHFEHGSKK